MPLLTPNQYIQQRQAYSYADPDVGFAISQTGGLPYHGNFQGIFPAAVPGTHPNGVNLRKFEAICKSVFNAAVAAVKSGSYSPSHEHNMREVVSAVVHWKMASQGGRAGRQVRNVNAKWDPNVHTQLLEAYKRRSLSAFRIGGIRIPTASAFLRFLEPDEYGIVDRRVVQNCTQPAGITTMNLRSDGYINDTQANIDKYDAEYIPFLRNEAAWLNAAGATFNDVDVLGRPVVCSFRACDIEMALF